MAARLKWFINGLLLSAVTLTPLISANSQFGYEQIKVIFFILATSVTGLIWLFINWQRFKIEWNSLKKASLLFTGALLISSLVGIDPKISFLGREPYFQGFILYALLLLFSLMVSSVKINFKKWAIFLSLSSSAVALVAIEQWINFYLLGQGIPTYAGRVISTFGQPNFYSGFILMTLPFGYLLISQSRWWWISILIGIMGILISLSRISITLLILIIAFWLIFQLQSKVRWALAVLSTLVILSTAALSLNLASGPLWKEFVKPQDQQWLIDNSPEKRIYLWQVIGNLLVIRPILGYGLENIEPSFANYFLSINFNSVNNPALYSLKDLVVDRSHSYPLDLLMFSGLIGLGSWSFLLWQLLLRVKSKILMISLLVYIIWSLVQIQSIAHLMFFWLLVGIVAKKSN